MARSTEGHRWLDRVSHIRDSGPLDSRDRSTTVERCLGILADLGVLELPRGIELVRRDVEIGVVEPDRRVVRPERGVRAREVDVAANMVSEPTAGGGCGRRGLGHRDEIP